MEMEESDQRERWHTRTLIDTVTAFPLLSALERLVLALAGPAFAGPAVPATHLETLWIQVEKPPRVQWKP